MNSSGDCVIFELDSKVLKYWKVTAAMIFAAVFSAFCLILNGFWVLKAVLFFALSAVLLVLVFWYFPTLADSTDLSIENGRIICRKGVFLKREYIYPNPQIIYFQRIKLPVALVFGLQWVILRGSGNSLLLPPLTVTQVECLIAEVMKNGEK